jgi:hypothetical protein
MSDNNFTFDHISNVLLESIERDGCIWKYYYRIGDGTNKEYAEWHRPEFRCSAEIPVVGVR